uniref:Glia maturation factor beta n=1 Tax=Oryzias melastigma TaxID=30732 RepID=A0A3B3E049_ORYME
MSESLVVCDVDEDLVKKLRQFRFRKETNNAAIVMKIDKDRQLVILDEEHEDISPDDLKDELPERQPRFIVYSYKYQHDDGRVSYPLCFIFSSPVGCRPEQQMMYAGSKNKLVQTVELTKVSDPAGRETGSGSHDLTEPRSASCSQSSIPHSSTCRRIQLQHVQIVPQVLTWGGVCSC